MIGVQLSYLDNPIDSKMLYFYKMVHYMCVAVEQLQSFQQIFYVYYYFI